MLKRYLKAGWTVSSQTGSHVQVEKDNLNKTIPMYKLLKSLKKDRIK
jgi:predicted RNA binding protein YcfA (HicA-like mRNA interferase family)